MTEEVAADQVHIWGSDTRLCEAKEESDATENLQSLCSMIQHHIPAGVTGTLLYA